MTEEHEARRELGAIAVVGAVFAIGGAILLGVFVGLWATIIVTAGFALVAIVGLIAWSTRRAHPQPFDAPHVQPLDDGRYRILVVADERCVTPAFIDELRSHASGRPASVFVTAPALESRLGLLGGDQKAYDDATQRLKEALEALEEAGLQAQGRIGASDPLQAADDGLRQFPANEIVFATHRDGETNWLEDGVVALAESRYDQPVEHISVAAGRGKG